MPLCLALLLASMLALRLVLLSHCVSNLRDHVSCTSTLLLLPELLECYATSKGHPVRGDMCMLMLMRIICPGHRMLLNSLMCDDLMPVLLTSCVMSVCVQQLRHEVITELEDQNEFLFLVYDDLKE